VWLHGGPHAQHTASFEPFFQLLAEAGFAVLLPNPRGSTGRGWAFSASTDRGWGTCDYDDVMALVDEAVRQGLVDGERLGVGGWSYGGYFTNHILTRTRRFKAAVSGGSLSNMLADYGVSDVPFWTERRLGLPWAAPAKYIDASPLFRVDRVQTPTLVLCGQNDMRTPLGHSEQWYHALKRVGVAAQLVIYPGEGHSPSEAAWEDVMVRSIGWYSRLLRPGVQSGATRGAGVRAGSSSAAGGGR
jgi:dipeptidyl aminopeptidase/acylaminoacyl peptidase